MAKPKSGAKKAAPSLKKDKPAKLLKSAAKNVAKAEPKPAKKAPEPKAKAAPAAAPAAKEAKAKPASKAAAPAPAKVAAEKPSKAAEKPAKAAAEKPSKVAGKPGKAGEKPGKAAAQAAVPQADRPRPRATKLPPPGEPLTKRELEQILTVGEGRGVTGEGSLKGRLVLVNEMPHLIVIGRDKRELSFLLQGPDQEVFPAYVEHKVSVSGLIRKVSNHGGSVDVRKYSAKRPDAEAAEAAPPVDTEPKLRYLSPGEVSMATAAGMGAGIKGFAAIRGNLEMTGEEFVLVVANGGTRQQVSFRLEGKGAKGLRRNLGQTLQVTGVVDKSSGWGGILSVESMEPRPSESRAISRDEMEIVHVEGEVPTAVDVRLNHGFTVRLQEQPGFTWAIEPTVAKRVGLREAKFEPGASGGPATREFFFTPRNPGATEVEFFLAKAFSPGLVERSFKISVTVKP
ncbi:protease inhibitor I42 family protein [Myxococcaceae bacterium GXIMD 01537]